MGLLDDAIREHLELKRRRGADAGEIERAARDALGPVRRMPEPGDPTPYDGPHDEGDPALLDDELDYAYGEEKAEAVHEIEPMPSAHHVAEEPSEFFSRPPLDPADVTGHETAEYSVEHEHLEHDLFDEDRLADGRPAAGHGSAPASPEEGEDVLEETPEFLQDTPDHDRLWFEQRPPRDFKFDG